MSHLDPKAVKYQNHIVIGLGGTGGSALREFRKEMYRRHGSKVPDKVRVEYLYLDSSDTDLNNESDWKVMGQSVQLPQNSRLSISIPDLRAIVDNAQAYPGIGAWLGPRALWMEYLSAVQGLQAAGGQRRRLGRLLFAHNVTKFNQAVSSKYNALVAGTSQGDAGSAGVTFHIVCGLAGGTGSGSVVDVAAQIGHFIAERHKQTTDRIVIYAYLPESSPPAQKAERYYFANGYAALAELNALSAGRFHPCNVATGQTFRPGEFMPFNGCYVFTNETESGTTYHPDDAPGLLSGFLYQKIIAVKDAGSWPTLVRAENSENGLPDCEPRVGPEGRKPLPERSVRFMTFGIKRIAIPEAEIQEYLAYGYAREAVRQLRFNNWSSQFGYVDNVRNNDFANFRGEEKLAAFHCSWDHLILSRAILGADQKKSWIEIDEYWNQFLAHAMDEIVAKSDKRFWLNEIRILASEQLQKDYRGDGAVQFYQQKSATVQIEAREVVHLLETYLLTEFLGGRLSLMEITGSKAEDSAFRGIVEVVKEELVQRCEKSQEKAEHFRKLAVEIEEVLTEIEAEYAKIWVIDPFGRRTRLLEEHKQALSDYLSAKCKEAGYAYASRLCPLIVTQLEQLYDQTTVLLAGLNNLFQQFEEGLKKRCTEGDKPDFGRSFIKFYNAGAVRSYAARVRLDETLMAQQCGAVRNGLVSTLGFDQDKPSFKEFNQRLPAMSLATLMEQVCFAQSRNDHDALLHKPEDRLFGVDLVPRLLQDYRSAEQLADFAKRLVPQATTLAGLDDTERANVVANNSPESIVRRSISILGKGLVETPEHPKPEIRPLVAALRAAPPVGSGEMHFVDAVDQPSEMVVISLTNLLPLRCVKRTAFLRGRYGQLLNGHGASKADAMFLHLEGDGSQYPGLYALSMDEVRLHGRRILLLAIGTGIVKQAANAQNGRPVLRFEEQDSSGITISAVTLGTDIVSALEAITPSLYTQLSGAVELAARNGDHTAIRQQIAATMKELQQRTDLPQAEADGFIAAYRQVSAELV